MCGKRRPSAASAEADKQLVQAIETFRGLFDLMIKAWAFMVAVDGVVFGFGIVSRSFGPILLSALVTVIAAALPPIIGRAAIPIAYAAYAAERRLYKDGQYGLVQIFGVTVSKKLTEDFSRIYGQPDHQVGRELRKISNGRRFIGRRLTLLLVAIATVQVAVAVFFAVQGTPLFLTDPLDLEVLDTPP